MSATNATQFDASDETEARELVRERVADEAGFEVDLDDMDDHRADDYSCHTLCSVCPADTCDC